MQGTLSVDFAGTREEAREFCVRHQQPHRMLRVGNKPNIGNEGLPMITAEYRSHDQLFELIKFFEDNGWEESVIDKPFKSDRRRGSV